MLVLTTGTKTRHMDIRIAAILLMFVAGLAWAQAQPSSLDLQLPQPPDTPVDVSRGGAAPDDDASRADTATSVHGSFTTGIGYSKTYGNSTVNAAELDVNKQYDNGKTLNLHIDVLHSTGLPNVSPRDYVSRYPGY